MNFKNIKIGKKFLIISFIFSFIALGGVFLIWGKDNFNLTPELNPELTALEKKAEKGDTAALHKLLKFYDENSYVIIEVEEAFDAYGNEITDDEPMTSSYEDSLNELYLERLNYWLNKGMQIDDSVAKQISAMRSYYNDEVASISVLAELAENGDGQAALFCGSACYNQGMGPEAFKYLNMAYEMGVPSAGWHLAMCYSKGFGTEMNNAKALEVMRQSALLNYPEAVLEMKRVEPSNPIWKNKADSLEIDFPDFPILN